MVNLSKMLNFENLLTHSIGDTLGGHLDDMEADWSKPIVSMRYLFAFFLC